MIIIIMKVIYIMMSWYFQRRGYISNWTYTKSCTCVVLKTYTNFVSGLSFTLLVFSVVHRPLWQGCDRTLTAGVCETEQELQFSIQNCICFQYDTCKTLCISSLFYLNSFDWIVSTIHYKCMYTIWILIYSKF